MRRHAHAIGSTSLERAHNLSRACSLSSRSGRCQAPRRNDQATEWPTADVEANNSMHANMLLIEHEPIIRPKRAGPERAPSDDHSDAVTARALRQRIRQQELLAELGVLALQRTSFIGMLDQTVRMTAEGLGAEDGKVMEYIPAENRLLVRAGVGWDQGVVGAASVGADLASPAGFALRTASPLFRTTLKMSNASGLGLVRRARHSSRDERYSPGRWLPVRRIGSR